MTDSPTALSAVLLATTPASRLGCAEGTLLDRLTGQLASTPVTEVQVLTSAGGLAADLRGLAKLVRVATGTVALLPADLIAHTEALALLLEHPARDTRALVAGEDAAGPMRPPLRVEGGRITAAGSSFHTVPEANAAFAGVLQTGEADLGALADVAEELAELAESGRLGPVTPVEAADLLLVGLVRSGVRVRAAELGPLHAVRVFAGYAGWVPGQLEAEVAEGAWWVVDGPADDLITDEPESLWRRVLRRQGGLFLTVPEDPTLN